MTRCLSGDFNPYTLAAELQAQLPDLTVMTQNRALVLVHVAVAFFGLAGLFGKLVAADATVIVFGRTLFAALALAPMAYWFNRGGNGHAPTYALLGLGVLLAVHWVTFFLAIQIATVAIGLLTYASFPLFTLLLELAFRQRSWRWIDLILTAAVVAGLALITPQLSWESSVFRGALWGLLSGFTFALLTLANRHMVKHHSVYSIALWQYLGAAICLAPFATLELVALPPGELLLLVLLGVVFTSAAHGFFVAGLRRITAHTASLLASLEPIYGIAAAWLLLDEAPELRVLAGGLIILTTAVAATLIRTEDT